VVRNSARFLANPKHFLKNEGVEQLMTAVGIRQCSVQWEDLKCGSDWSHPPSSLQSATLPWTTLHCIRVVPCRLVWLIVFERPTVRFAISIC